MNSIAHRSTVLAAVLCVFSLTVAASEDSTWARLTVLLEPAPSHEVAPEQRLIPGGVVFADPLHEGGIEAFDAEAVRRVRRVGAAIGEVESAMRLAPLMVRQYEVVLPEGKSVSVPTLDLNPRLGTNLVLTALEPEMATFDVEFYYAGGDWKTPRLGGEQPITIALDGADLRTVIGMFSKVTGKPILIDDDVQGQVSVDFRDVPWGEALDLILRTHGLGSVVEGDAIRVSRLEDLNRRREVLAKAAVGVGRAVGSLAMIAGRDGPETPTVVLMVEPLQQEPPMPARHSGLVRFRTYDAPEFAASEPADGLVVVRFDVTEDGGVDDPVILSSPSEAASSATLKAAAGWRMAPILDEHGRRRRALVAFGIRTSIPK